MIRKTVSMLMVLGLLVMPSFSWSNESFVGSEYYGFDEVMGLDIMDLMMVDEPVTFASAQADVSSSGSWSFIDFWRHMSYVGGPIANLMEVYHKGQTVAGITIPDWTEYRSFPEAGSFPVFSYGSDDFVQWYCDIGSPSDNLNGGQYVATLGPVVLGNTSSNFTFPYSLDVSSFGDFSSFELSGMFYADAVSWSSEIVRAFHLVSSCTVFVNGRLSHIFYANDGVLDFSGMVISASVPITSIEFHFTMASSLSSSVNTSFLPYVSFLDGTPDFKFTVLTGDSALDGISGNTQGTVNQHEQLEGEWGHSMSENFNALDISNFTYPNGLISAFSLVSGIFQDFWNGLGEYKIYFTFPLYLGIVLLLVGRISKAVRYADHVDRSRAMARKEE